MEIKGKLKNVFKIKKNATKRNVFKVQTASGVASRVPGIWVPHAPDTAVLFGHSVHSPELCSSVS